MKGHPYRILIVDDSPAERRSYRRFLSRGREKQFRFAEAGDAEEGKALWRSFQPDCVLLDYLLPGTDGIELLKEFKSRDKSVPQAVVVLTGGDDDASPIDAIKAGALDSVDKTKITKEGLRRAVHNAIEKVRLLRKLAHKQKQLQKIAHEDELTGLYNRRYFHRQLEKELARHQRYHVPVSVLMLDADHFKRINDTYGHSAGDLVLKGIGNVLRSCLRQNDLAARCGGEEFCILAANTDLEGARIFAERVRRLIACNKVSPPGKPDISVTCSIGIASLEDDPVSADQLFERADEAMYEAKRDGRNRVCTWEARTAPA